VVQEGRRRRPHEEDLMPTFAIAHMQTVEMGPAVVE
jgi:hypothetical protein